MMSLDNRELSWLAFNDRVLQEARDKNVPLMQRLRFLGIFSSNQDEFIRVRLANLMRMVKSPLKSFKVLSGGYLPGNLLNMVDEKIVKNQDIFARIYADILEEMAGHGIRVIDETLLTSEQKQFCIDYFARVVSQRLVPLIINKSSARLLFLRDDRIYHGVKMERGQSATYAIILIPVSSSCPRFIQLPSSENKHDIIFLDDIIRLCLDDIFFMFDYDNISANTFKLMRDAELTLDDDDLSTSLVEKMEKGIEDRMMGNPVRLIYDSKMPGDLLNLIVGKLKLKKGELATGGRYHMMRDLMKFPKVRPDLEETETPPLPHPDIVPFSSIIDVIKKKDILVNFPYHTFNHFIDFLREAAIDPKVKSIYITLYRTAEHSKVINALINAAHNGKNVIALVELMARFDEEQNVENVDILQRAGIKVLHGIKDLKVHSKLVLVERKESGRRTVGYVYVGTGNLNESTARFYGDLGLFTSNSQIASDAKLIFEFLTNTHKHFKCKHLMAAPYFMRSGFEKLIKQEIKNAAKNMSAYIYVKCNTLTDQPMIKLLYKASLSGVKVKLIVRGACCLRPQVTGQSENIKAISIVDKFLEHSRLFIFANGGQEKIYISSADWMTRNLNKRLEIAAPILDANIQQALKDFFEMQWADNVKARDLSNLGANSYVSRGCGPRVRSQMALYEYYKNMKNTINSDSY